MLLTSSDAVYDKRVPESRWLQFRLSLSMRWSRFWNWLWKEEPVHQPVSVRMALGHFSRKHQDRGPDRR